MWSGGCSKKYLAALLLFVIGLTGCGEGSNGKGDIASVFIVLLSIISIFLLIEANMEIEEEHCKKIMQLYTGSELENEVMRWVLSHPKERITVEGLGKELGRPTDHVRSAVERLCRVTNCHRPGRS